MTRSTSWWLRHSEPLPERGPNIKVRMTTQYLQWRRGPEMGEAFDVVLVTSPGCHYCDEALNLIEGLAETYPLRLTTIPLCSERGRSLLTRHRIPFPPILLVDGEFFGYGRISRRKLEAHLAGRTVEEGVV